MSFSEMKSRINGRGDLRIALLFVILIAGFGLQSSSGQQTAPSAIEPEVQAALDRISENSLRGHLSFIASDLLEGRDTPSRGLDIAAEYIAAQFRRAGLEPVGDANESGEKGYFQIANWKSVEPDATGFSAAISDGKQTINLTAQQITMNSQGGLDLPPTEVVKINAQDEASISALTAEQVSGKIVFGEALLNNRELLGKLAGMNPAMLVMVNRAVSSGRGVGGKRLIDPESQQQSRRLAVLTMHDPEAIKFLDALPIGTTTAKLAVRLPMKEDRAVQLRNVVGLLRGSDPILKDTYVLVTAHYDHIGVKPGTTGDNINNGANDDGSGTVSVIELASALSSMKTRPKRSILFMTFFGEEKGLLGSRHYGKHPIFPLEKTVADVNLEHVGRTDDVEGDKAGTATLTGFDFSDLGPIFKKAGELTGINVYKHEKNSDSFFGRSDNQAMADAGVPAHTLCVAFIFPDYHQVGDHWEKVNYPNLAKTNRMVALALTMIASNPETPKWNEANPKTARYIAAWKKLQGK